MAEVRGAIESESAENSRGTAPPGSVPRFAADWWPTVYDELRRRAGALFRGENTQHTLQPTALVHQAFIRLTEERTCGWPSEADFLAAASEMMRFILVDHARAKHRLKRGGKNARRFTLTSMDLIDTRPEVDLLVLDEALTRLAALSPRASRGVEMRFFGGMSLGQIGEVLGVSRRTVELDWRHAQAWLLRELDAGR